MKRYRDYKIELPNYETAMALLSCVENKATSIGMQVFDQSKGKGTFGNYIAFLINTEELPKVRLVLSVYKTEGIFTLSIVNIVPTQDSGFSSLDKEVYNKILQYFVDSVLTPVNAGKYKVYTNLESYTLEEQIPLSWNAFFLWVDAFPLSHHPHDQERWMNFVIALHKNKEDLSISDFEEWLQTEKGWSYDEIDYFSSKLEYGLELLEEYDRCDQR